MVYDSHAQKLGIKAIGTVESNLTYDAINYNDPITVGVAQWYGTRAAGILNQMRTGGTWTGVASTLTADLIAHPETESWWTTRYLTRAEGESVKPMLLANKGIQNTQFINDLDGYVDVAAAQGMNVNANTNAVLFFASMYHQSPRSALRVLAAAGPSSSLDRLYNAALNDSVLGQYRTRQTRVREVILSGDTSGVDGPSDPSPNPDEGEDNPSTGNPTERATGDIRYLQQWRDHMYIVFKDGQRLICYANGNGEWIPSQNSEVGGDVPPPNPVVPEVPPSADVVAKRQAVVDWMTARVGRYKYSQGASRLNPEQNLYTDCSGLLYYCFKTVLNITLGTYTGAQYTQGTRVVAGSGDVPLSQLALGDCVYFNWTGGRDTVDHVEMYMGGGQEIGHGGPGPGPTIKGLQGSANRAVNWYVQRFIV